MAIHEVRRTVVNLSSVEVVQRTTSHLSRQQIVQPLHGPTIVRLASISQQIVVVLQAVVEPRPREVAGLPTTIKRKGDQMMPVVTRPRRSGCI